MINHVIRGITTRGRRLWESVSRTIQGTIERRRSVPVRQQLTASECGAACLAMVLSYFGRNTSVSECRTLCDGGRSGVTGRAIASAAQGFGLIVRGYTLDPSDLQDIPLPAIAHWGFNHFVVVESWSTDRVIIIDPAQGRRRLSGEVFDQTFTGVVLTFEVGPLFTRKAAKFDRTWLRYVRLIRELPKASSVFAQIVAASLLIQLLALSLPLFTKLLIDKILPFGLFGLLNLLGLGLFVIVLAQTLTSYLRDSLLLYIRRRFDSVFMVKFVKHLLSLPYRFFQQRTSGDLLMRLESSALIREALTGNAISILLDIGFMLTYILLLLLLKPEFGVLVLVLGGSQFLALYFTSRHVTILMHNELAASASEQSYTVEMLRGIATIKSSGVEHRIVDRWCSLFYRSLNYSMRRNRFTLKSNFVIGILQKVSPLIILWVGAHGVLDGRMSLGSLLAISAIAVYVLTPISALIERGQQLQLVGASLTRVNDVMASEPEESEKHSIALSMTGRIEADQLGFGYDLDSELVLRDVTFSLEPGQTLAIVGASGSGKSTLAFLLLGLYEPTYGTIRFDGIPLQELDRRHVRSQIGVVLQDSFSFSGSIRQNITLSDPSITLSKVIDAARLAGIHAQVENMPMRYETLVGEGALSLSGGERQRVAIARALTNHPKILILDEATSHLDVETESEIHRNLSKIECTKIIIAHRLTTVRDADIILVIDNGLIVERGTHAQLISRAGRYAALFNQQVVR
jgi:ATP-binding cassette, subfamily B, bacterial